jgi:hypothetical protein
MCTAAVVRCEVKNLLGTSGRSYKTLLKLDLTEIYVNMCLDSSGSQQDLEAGICESNNANLCSIKRW